MTSRPRTQISKPRVFIVRRSAPTEGTTAPTDTASPDDQRWHPPMSVIYGPTWTPYRNLVGVQLQPQKTNPEGD